MTASPPVSVVVVSWNTRDLLARCLDSLAISHSAGLAHVVVVDNASSDGSAELVRERYQWAELVATQENLGFGTAVNVGARASDSPWIAAANADIELSEDTLGELLQAGSRWPRCGVLAPRLVQSDDYVQGSVFAFPRLLTILLASTGFFALSPRLASRMHSGRWDPEREAEVEWALGAFLMLRREAFVAVGGFDERLWMYAEDLDLCWRLRRADWATVYVPGAAVRHVGGASTSQAFGAPSGTPEMLEAGYGWIARRRGIPTALAFGFVASAGAAARVAFYAVGALLRIPGGSDRMRGNWTWFALTVRSVWAVAIAGK